MHGLEDATVLEIAIRIRERAAALERLLYEPDIPFIILQNQMRLVQEAANALPYDPEKDRAD